MLLTGRLVTPAAIMAGGALVVGSDRITFAAKASPAPRHHRDARSPAGGSGRGTSLPGLVDAHRSGSAGSELGGNGASAGKGLDHIPIEPAGTLDVTGRQTYARRQARRRPRTKSAATGSPR
jgi:cytosine/adenosine deaminase-related metal-dependent hydrolase